MTSTSKTLFVLMCILFVFSLSSIGMSGILLTNNAHLSNRVRTLEKIVEVKPVVTHKTTIVNRQGHNGHNGSNGERGIRGIAGVNGSRGSQGVRGAVGETGSQGARGSRGSQGSAGARGTEGPPGPRGAEGPPGPVGPAGKNGITTVITRTVTVQVPVPCVKHVTC